MSSPNLFFSTPVWVSTINNYKETNEKMDALKIQERRSFRNNREYSKEFSAFYERLKGI